MTGFARWIGYLTMVTVMGCLLALALGFGWFVWQIADEEVQIDRKADGIVVLTGAASRIPDAIVLLTTDRGKRLLITGVNPSTTAREIAQLTALNEKMFACCIDLDRSALNTVGNAVETRRWAKEKGFNSLIIVTSNWHMPRAMVEIAHHVAGRNAHSVSGCLREGKKRAVVVQSRHRAPSGRRVFEIRLRAGTQYARPGYRVMRSA